MIDSRAERACKYPSPRHHQVRHTWFVKIQEESLRGWSPLTSDYSDAPSVLTSTRAQTGGSCTSCVSPVASWKSLPVPAVGMWPYACGCMQVVVCIRNSRGCILYACDCMRGCRGRRRPEHTMKCNPPRAGHRSCQERERESCALNKQWAKLSHERGECTPA